MIPVARKVEPPVQFTPFQGLMAVAKRLAGVIEQRTGAELWSGPDGLEGVTADILRGFGLSEQPINLGGDGRAISPRVVAEACGLPKRKSQRKRRVR